MPNLNIKQVTENIGRNILSYRKRNRITQTEMAELIGVTRPALGAYEEFRAIPKITTLIKLSDLTGCDIRTIVTENIFQEGGIK